MIRRMRAPLVPLLLALTLLVAPGRTLAADASSVEHPLGSSVLAIRDGGSRRVSFKARWSGSTGTFNPALTGATLRIAGAPGEGDSGLIQLPAANWSTGGHGKKLRYTDPKGAAGGIRSVVVTIAKRGGSVRVKGGRTGWRYVLDRPQTHVIVTLTIGPARWCAEFNGKFAKNARKRLQAASKTAPASCPCDGGITSTWDAIQTLVFARHGCTESICHGSAPGQGGLDLQADVAYHDLVDVPSSAVPGQKRVEPGSQDASLLYRKLAAKTLGTAGVPGSPMPSGDIAALSTDELKAIELWIHNGAPETGVVVGTDRLLASCLPPAKPTKIRPPDPPAPTEGFQLYAPPWPIPAHSENEVCYATYYDLSAQIPAEQQLPCPDTWGGPGKNCVYYDRGALTQDPNSHHSIPRIYRGSYDVTHPGWGQFTCHGGARDGQACDPRGGTAQCGEGGGCAGTTVSAVACTLYGPPDFGYGFNLADSDAAPYILISTQPLFQVSYPSEVSNILPVQGIMVWNSHAFNLTDEPTTNEQWLNIYFSGPSDRRYLSQGIFSAEDIFIENVPPFEKREYCRTTTFEQGTRIFHLSSHSHKRGKLFRVWGPGIADACSAASATCTPETTAPILTTTDYADPAQVVFDPPMALDGADPASRRLKFCAIYDNGATDPGEVKRRSTAPPNSNVCRDEELRCLSGPHKGEPCAGTHVCDDLCDACPVKGGVTTDDEMFIMLGAFYCPENTSCFQPVP